MATKEKAMHNLKAESIVSHYLRLKHDVYEYEIHDVQNNMVDVSFISTSKGFADPYINIESVNFKDKRVTGTLDVGLAKMYVQDNFDEAELF